MEDAARRGPLAGVKVLDLTSVVLGPLATQILGDLGAEVIKVETPDGDLMRFNGTSRQVGMSSIFLAINRNKRSLALDLKQAEGRDVFLRLVADVDVLVHNMRIPALERLGLGYDKIRSLNPDIIYCAATGFGQDGPHRSKPAFDDIVQAACGIASLLGEVNGAPDYVPTLLADKTAGLLLANAVLAALFHLARTGEGQYVEVPMLESLVEFTLTEHMGGMAFQPALGKAGYGRIVSGGRKPQRTEDGYVAILPYGPTHWRSLFLELGRSDLLTKYTLTSRADVNAVVRDLYRELGEITPFKTTACWVATCEALDIPVTPIYGIDDLPEHPHLKAVGMFQTREHPTEGTIRMVRPATRFATTPAGIRTLAPGLGQHSAEVLLEAGFSACEVEKLARDGVIKDARRSAPQPPPESPRHLSTTASE